ncbi:MAG: hypothetical protein GY943_18170 [Chloroflexi bacterium]|nr:hypothetical protein [Chloroflexota bacterium]
MNPNPLLNKLGLSDNDRVILFHADDVGICQATIDAYAEIVDSGLTCAVATMAPCSWFPATAVYNELRAIASDWQTRVADYELFIDKTFQNYVKQCGMHLVGWRTLKELQ